MKETTKKLILFITLCVVTVFILFIAVKINNNRKDNILSKSMISRYLTEIKYQDISNYVSEEASAIIYVSNSSDKKTIKFDEILVPVIKKYNLNNKIVYININNTNIEDHFYKNSPELVYYKNGNITDVIDASTFSGKKDVINWLKERSIIDD